MTSRPVAPAQSLPRSRQGTRPRGGLLAVLLALTLGVTFLPAAPAAAGTCSTPTVQTHRGIQGTFDQCVERTFDQGGTTYGVQVYYTETTNASDAAVCAADDDGDGSPDRPAAACEHALADVDDASGDNTRAVQVADETIAALQFYFTRDRPIPIVGGTDMQVFIGEDARGGGIPTCTSLWWDDEWVDPGDPLTLRVLAFHEAFHLAQFCQYDSATGSHGEGVARALEDRVDVALDANLGNLFIPEVSQHLSSEGPGTPDAMGSLPAPRQRADALDDQWYWSMLWWTYLFDQTAGAADVEPTIGWDAIDQFYDNMASNATDVGAAGDLLSSQGSSFRDAFRRYGQALFAHKYNPTDPALQFRDSEIVSSTPQLAGHTVRNGNPGVVTDSFVMNPRSNRHFEYRPDANCDAVTFEFDGKGQDYGWAVLGVDDPNLVTRAESYSDQWSATVLVGDLDRIAGVVTSTGSSGTVDVDSGCGDLTVEIEDPTSGNQAIVGEASDPKRLLARLDVDGPDGEPVQGLTADAFEVVLERAGAELPVTVLSAAEVQSDYWLLLDLPTDADGAATGLLYGLTARVGGAEGTSPNSVLYAEQPDTDLMVVTDQSGSMATANKIEAARNAGELLVEELTDDDQVSYTAFDEAAVVREPLAPVGVADHRDDTQDTIRAEVPDGATSIGGGMQASAADHDGSGQADHSCAFVLLSDGEENADPRWNSVAGQVADNGCPIHVVGLGPGANEPLLQQIAGAVPGGSYDYAGTGPDGGAFAGGPSGGPFSGGATTWQNGLAAVYDLVATRVGQRERVISIGYDTPPTDVTCTDTVTTATFADAVPTSIEVGQQMTSGGIVFTGAQFPDDRAGSATVNDADEVKLDFLTMVTSRPACQVEYDVRQFQGDMELRVNGASRVYDSFTEMAGTSLGGARIEVVNQGQGQTGLTATIRITGQLSSFGFGGEAGGSVEFPNTVHLRQVRVVEAESGGTLIPVDSSAELLVATISTQNSVGGDISQLYRPDGAAELRTKVTKEPHGSSEVWTVVDPAPGLWRMTVTDTGSAFSGTVSQPVLITASLVSDLTLELLLEPTDELVDAAVAGVEVPIVAVFSDQSGPVTGATVTATVTDPDGFATTLALRDDGEHGDGAADDGFYGGTYTATSFGDTVIPGATDGEEPAVGGSYRVDVEGIRGVDRREDSDSFALGAAPDDDLDGLPNDWETRHGLDPNDPSDADSDGDRDGLDATCEFQAGTDPRNRDSDGGGTSDGEEVVDVQGRCRPGDTNPNDPTDDPVGPIDSATARPEVDGDGQPVVVITWGNPVRPGDLLVDVDIWCQPVDRATSTATGPYTRIAQGVSGNEYLHRAVSINDYLRCQVDPRIQGPGGPTDAQTETTSPVPVSDDPYPPEGTILIEDGAATTPDDRVDLQITVDDLSSPGHDGPGGAGAFPGGGTVPGTPSDELEMRVGNGAAVDPATPWQPYAPEVTDFTLRPDRTGLATVSVEFRDRAGNIGAGGLFMTDTIEVEATRIAGPSRIETAVEVSISDFPVPQTADSVLVARADIFPDAIAGGPLAVERDGPMLLTPSGSLHPATAAELQRVLPPGGQVYVLGGPVAISDDVVNEIRALGFSIRRLSGATRVETAIAIADELGSPNTLLLAHAYDFPDPLIAAAAAPRVGAAVLLTGDGRREAATDAFLASKPGATLWAVGDAAASAYPEATPLVGADAAATATVVARQFTPDPVVVGLARDDDFPDALAGGAHIARREGPILLTGTASLSAPTSQLLCEVRDDVDLLVVYGGSAAVSDAVFTSAGERLGGVGC